MIQDKLRFSDDSSVIERKCLSCKQFSHRFSICPKLHYIADKEKIIKKNIFSSNIHNRIPFIRRNKRLNGLKNFLFNNFSAKKKNYTVEVPNVNLIYEHNAELSSYIGSFEELDGLEAAEERKKSKEELNKYPIMLMKREGEENEQKLKIHSEKNFHFQYNALESGKKQINEVITSMVSNQSKSSFEEAVSEIQEKMNEYKTEANRGTKNYLKGDILYYFFDKVHNYKNYFCDSNIEKIVKRQSKVKRVFRECNKNSGFMEKYKNLKFYSFYSNAFMEILLKEVKAKNTKNNKSQSLFSSYKNVGLGKENKEESSANENEFKHNNISRLRKTYFDIPKKIDTKKTIQELIVMIKTKDLKKKKSKI